MASERYNLIFRGDIVLGHNIADVRVHLGKLFKVSEAQLERLFSGRPVVIKKSLPKPEADRYTEALRKAGAEVEIQLIADTAPTPIVKAAEKKQAKTTLAERLAQQEASGGLQEPSGTLAFAPKAKPKSDAQLEQGLVLAPVGSALLADQYREDEPVVDIQPVEAELRPMQGNLIDQDERKEDVPPIGVDLSGISLADAGEDLLDEADRSLPVPEVEPPADIKLAPVGADLAERRAQEPILNFDLSAIQLAER